ncbi:AAA+ ATPase domain-containing protein [Cupriavidus oxalaticus]|uniref:AAA family ATPase n=1 Tax=Cupriavidus oxalaticus TaxID=96344 RepID=UPI003F73CC02
MLPFFSPEVPVLLIGAPGVGKTARVREQFDYAEVVLTSTCVEEDIAGLPYREGDFDYRTVPGLFRRLHEAADAGKSTVLFLDELDKARRSVADTLLTLVASRRIGSASLPDDTCIVAAANPPEFGGGDGISDAMISRFTAIDYVPEVCEWADWAVNHFDDADAGRVIAAVRNGEMPIFDITGEGLARRITSPRTIAMALSAMQRHGAESDMFDSVVRGLLTPATASQVLHLARTIGNEVLERATTAARRSASQKRNPPVLRL